MIKKILLILALGSLPALSLAAGDMHHTSDHLMPAHAMGNHHTAPTAAFYGQAGEPDQVNRSIEVNMDDSMRFTPSNINVKAGETIRFRITNSGQLPHEMVIGSIEELKAHAAEMLEIPGMEHSDPSMITVEPGQSGELIWQFAETTEVDFACLIPGHTEAGMVGKIHVK